MPRFDGTGPRGEGMLSGRGEGFCALRLVEPGSGELVMGYAGIQGRPVCFGPDSQQMFASDAADASARKPDRPQRPGRRRRCSGGRCKSRQSVVR